jgi:Ni/Co efflux regulator RcnB
MKRLVTAALALSLLGGTAAMAQPDHGYGQDNRQGYSSNNGHDNGRDNGRHMGQQHNWARGQRLPPEYRGRDHYVDYRRHHLRAPPRGYQWVQVDNNYALVALTSGLISSIIASR